MRSASVTLAEIKEVVETSDKQRFQLIRNPSIASEASKDDDDPSMYLVRATQGHSIAISSENLLTPLSLENCPAEVVHGTFPKAWGLIKATGGLKRMGRTHVHFATGLPGEGGKTSEDQPPAAGVDEDVAELDASEAESQEVISGMRKDASILIWVDVRRSLDEGLKWWRSANGVILTEGDEHGKVPIKYFTRVEERGGGLLYTAT
jgi:2'-phosphotransferase